MKTTNYIKSIALALATAFSVSLFVLADGESKGPSGRYLDDATAGPVVASGSYVTFSIVYNGRRYYLGVDTVAARAVPHKDTVTYYEGPNYATMWVVGPNWSETGAAKPNKDYTRTIQSVWMDEQVHRDRFLALGAGSGTYNTLILRDTLVNLTRWHTAKDTREQNRYINGFLYYYSDATATGVDVYRYLTYDPLYGFSRLYGTRPANSQRISIWDRKTGSDLIYHMTPSTITFGYSDHDTIQPITSQVTYYTNVNRFRSRFDHVDVYVSRSEPITDQTTLIASPYNLSGHYEWKSNPMDHSTPTTISSYDGNSLMPCWTITGYSGDPDPEPVWGWQNFSVVHARQSGFELKGNIWYDTIYAVASLVDDPEGNVRVLRKPAGGGAPTEGLYANQNDWLYTHFECAGNSYKDSVLVVFQTFHKEKLTTLETEAVLDDVTIEGITFPYRYNGKLWDGTTPATPEDIARTVTINAMYTSNVRVVTPSGSTAASTKQEHILDLLDRDPYEEGGLTYNSLEVEALNADGSPCSWITVTCTAKNEIQISVAEYDPDAAQDRIAQVRYTYRYLNTKDHTDKAVATRSIWITQEWINAHSSDDPSIYSFAHKDTEADGLQAVHEKHNTMYAIPGENLSLPLHRDHWGYYRWFIYDEGAKRDRDVQYMNTWSYALGANPKNNGTPQREFMLINQTSGTTSRGRWDMIKDVANPSNPVFENDHFIQWTPTPIPAVKYPEKTSASITKSGKIACDVSEYFDVVTTGMPGSDLTAMTEPTLSYRQVFNIHPAKERADQLAAVKGNGNGANWLETHTVVVPAGREFHLQPQNPIAVVGSDEINEEHLQYIYYANPTASKIGTREDLTDDNLQHGEYYARVGVKKSVGRHVKLTLITKEMLENLGNGNSISNVVLINPKKSTGFVIGNDNDQSPCYMADYTPYRTTKTDLEDALEAKILSQPRDDAYNNYYLTIQQSGSGDSKEYFFTKNNYRLYDLYTLGSGINTRWYNPNAIIPPTGKAMFSLQNYGGSLIDENIPNGYTTGDIQSFYIRWSAGLTGNSGYLRADGTIKVSSGGTWPERAWLLYKVEILHDTEFEEIPRWEKWNGSAWTEVACWNYTQNKSVSPEGVTGYEMTADGSLHITNENGNVHPDAGENIAYRLRTEHFQLAKFTGITRPADTEMLNLGDIITEEDIERDYNIIYSLDMEHWPAPASNEVVAYNYHFPWDFTELSYHYPLSVVPADKRVFNTEMPGKGEYAFINKFIVPEGGTMTSNHGEIFESMAGAENGYMLCVNAAGKRTTIMNFEYDQLSCSGQQIYLVGNYCNPVQSGYEPQITADLEGWNGSQWVPIYRYKSGKIPYKAHDASDGHWYQMALPIARERIMGYTKFRCRAEIDGAPNHNAYLLIDRLRFIEKARGFSVFQNKASCISDKDSVSVLIRLDYTADSTFYKPGRLVAYQFQKWDNDANGGEGGYVPMLASKKTSDSPVTYEALVHTETPTPGEPTLEVFPGYMKDAFTATEAVTTPSLKSYTGNDYGYVLIPEAGYDPNKSDQPSFQSVQRAGLIEKAIAKLGLIDPAATARRAFINEKNNVRTFDQVMSNDQLFGGVTPHIKSYVKEGDKWVIYIASRLPVSATEDNATFRIGMTLMDSLNLNDPPTFAQASCATFHVFKIKQTTALRLGNELWTNHPRTWYDNSPGRELLSANETYRTSVAVQIDDKIFGKDTKNPRCKFDFLHAAENVRADDPTGNAAFEEKYGCTRTEFVDAMATFRNDDEDNLIREEYEWAKVKPADFEWSGRSSEEATVIYNRLNKLINDGVLELGLNYRDIYMGDRANSYFYLLPIPASGRYELVLGNHDETADTTMHASVCNDTLWLELHSKLPTAKLRFGYDSRVGDTYIVPTIRASRSEAMGEDGKYLDVRVAEIMAEDPAYSTIIGYEKTQLIGSNDPAWTGAQIFKYRQGRNMIGKTPNVFAYYTAGDTIHFEPVEGNTITLKAGYWYQFKVPFYAAAKENTYAADPVEPTGHSQFILAIAPDTVRWTPAHADAANIWNDDYNWTPVMHNIPEDGFKATVPMADTKVIIPKEAEGMQPIVSDVVEDQKDTLHYGYEKNTCSKILFYPNAEILGQERLTYNTAYVDVALKTGNWQTFSPALDDVYSGDMYIPFSTSYDKKDPASGASTDNVDFEPQPFPYGAGSNVTYNPRVYPFAFYQGFYNSSVPVPYYNTDKDDMPVAADTVQSKSSVDWVKTNALNMHYKPGAASILTGYDATDLDDQDIVVRLPKPGDSYCGFGKNGGTTYDAGPAVEINRPNKMTQNLAYDQYAKGFSTENGLTYELKNATASDIFFFGNPTMSLIDVYRLCVANESVLKHDGGTYRFTAYNLIGGDNYDVRNITGPGQYFVLPQRAVGLVAATAAKTLSIKLTPSALVAYTGDGDLVNSETPDVASPMPRRAMHAAETVNQKRLYIAASNETDMGVKKAYLTLGEQTDAIRGYRFGEDALSIVSGLNYYSDESFSTPLSMYTIADNEALMLDIRDTLRYVPIVFTTLDNKFDYSEYTLLSFATEGNWTEPLYLCDALTGDSVRIANGMQIVVATPLSDQLRYYINGIRRIASGEEQQGTATGIDLVEDAANDQMVNDQMVYIYDVLGRKVAVLGENDLLTRINLPTGVYIISRGDKTERIVIK